MYTYLGACSGCRKAAHCRCCPTAAEACRSSSWAGVAVESKFPLVVTPSVLNRHLDTPKRVQRGKQEPSGGFRGLCCFLASACGISEPACVRLGCLRSRSEGQRPLLVFVASSGHLTCALYALFLSTTATTKSFPLIKSSLFLSRNTS